MRLDTVKVKCSSDAIKELDEVYFKKELIVEGGRVERERWKYSKPQLGLVGLQVEDSKLIVEFSSKILKEKYGELLNLNTIEEALSNINEGIQLDPAMVIEEGVVLKADVTNDLHVEKPVPHYLRSLFFFNHNNRFQTYTKQDESISFYNKSRRIQFYWKYLELTNQRKNQDILKYINTRRFTDVLRMENRLASFKLLRDSFGCENNLYEILSSEANPNHHIFKRIRMPEPQILLDYEPGEVKFSKIVQREGYKEILRQCSNDLKIFRKLVAQYVKGDLTHYLRIAKRILAEMEERKDSTRFSLLDEVETKLAG